MAKVPESISMDETISERIRKIAKEEERSFSWVGEKILLKGLEVFEKEGADAVLRPGKETTTDQSI